MEQKAVRRKWDLFGSHWPGALDLYFHASLEQSCKMSLQVQVLQRRELGLRQRKCWPRGTQQVDEQPELGAQDHFGPYSYSAASPKMPKAKWP